MSLLRTIKKNVRVYLGLAWIEEATKIAEEAKVQREFDEAAANLEPHDMARWLKDPAAYRRPRPGAPQ